MCILNKKKNDMMICYFLKVKKFCFYLIFCCSIIISWPQINFHVTDESTECLRISAPKLTQNEIQEILSFCLTKPSKSNNQTDEKLTFDDLRKANVRSEQLYYWSASIDFIEQYEEYLISNGSLIMSNQSLFSNCTQPRFGSLCQYEFVYLPNKTSELNEIIVEFYEMFDESTSLTCYVDLECDRGSNLICLDWTEICDGYVDCINEQIDEKFCWKLEINECQQDEYRCLNGQCISKEFALEKSNMSECVDQPSQLELYPFNLFEYEGPPILDLEDIRCRQPSRSYMFYRFLTSSCHSKRRRLLQDIIINDQSNTLINICSFTFYCTFYVEHFYSSICKDICDGNRCLALINETCPQLIVTTNIPIAFAHVYVGYLRQTNDFSYHRDPDYICYQQNLCGHSNLTSFIVFNNKTCYQTTDLLPGFISPTGIHSTILKHIHTLHILMSHCNTIVYDHPLNNIDKSQLIYRCRNSSKYISIARVCNDISDCIQGDDEQCLLINDQCSPIDSDLLFKCYFNNRCISLTRFGDNQCDCPLTQPLTIPIEDVICEDETFHLCDVNRFDLCHLRARNNYAAKVISFATICDGFQELLPILVDGSYSTDENECQYWQCNNTYTRCDGFWNCLDGADEIGCEMTHCPLNHHLCIEPSTFELTCLPLSKAHDGHIDCLGATDEPQLCRSKDYSQSYFDIYCNSMNSTSCIQSDRLCSSDCLDENDKYLFCNLSNRFDAFDYCSDRIDSNTSHLVRYLCTRYKDRHKIKIKHFSLEQTTTTTTTEIEVEEEERGDIVLSSECHRGYPLRSLNEIICLCPTNYYGSQCQYQKQRISLTLRFQTYSDSRRTLFAVVIQLIDNSSQRLVHSSKQLTYIYIKHCQTKFKFYLTYLNYRKEINRSYFIHINFYEKLTFAYRGSLYIPIEFVFLPVHRLSYVLTIPRDNRSMMTMPNPLNSTCSLDSLFVGYHRHRPICICPRTKWGPRCFLRNHICQQSTCFNQGQCILTDDEMISEKKFFCICPKGFSGDRCQIEDTKIVITFDDNIILTDMILVHFIEIQQFGLVKNGSTFQSIPFYQRNVTIRWSHPFHIVFIQLTNRMFYLIHIQTNSTSSNSKIEKFIRSSDRCGQMNEYFNETIVNSHLIRRIKFYHLPCQNNSLLSCFYDRDHFCLCQNFGFQRIANCFEFNSTLIHNCYKLSNCQNNGQCIQDSVQCPQTSRCICEGCFYGSLCQFSSSLFDISLDSILGSHIQPNRSLSHQSQIIHITLFIIILLILIGFLNFILSFIAFQRKETRQVGCGYYLLVTTMTTLFISIMLLFKFSILLVAQMNLIRNRTFLLIQCVSFDYLLQVFVNMNRWLNACIAIERALNIIQGTNFNKKKSKKIAKYLITFVIIMILMSTIYDPIHRRLVDDDSNDEYKRIWCIVSYNSMKLQSFNKFMQMFHFFISFLTNIISSLIIIILSTNRRRIIQKDQRYFEILKEQIEQHRHLLIAPFVLIVLSLPRLLISLIAGCITSNRHPWLYLLGYLISFLPAMLTFIIFVLPSEFYQEQFQKAVKSYRERLSSLSCYHR